MKKFILAIFVLLASALTGCSQIDTGNVGVESTLGQVKSETLKPGTYFTMFKRVTEICAKEIPVPLNDLKPQTSDKIIMADMDVDIYIQMSPGKAAELMTKWPGDIYEEKGEDCARVGMNYVSRQAREAVYNISSKIGSATIHTERTRIAAELVAELQTSLDKDLGKDTYMVRSSNIRNLVTDPALEANIKAAAQAQFKLEEEKNRLKVSEVEADRKRTEARGEADAIRIKAEAVAKQGGAEYVQLEAIKKWDGKLPVTSAGGAVPFVNLK